MFYSQVLARKTLRKMKCPENETLRRMMQRIIVT